MMLSFRTLTRRWLPLGLKKSFQQLLLGYDSYAPSFSSAGEDMMLRHMLGSDKMSGFYVDVGAFHPTLFSNTYFFYLNGWQGINVEARPGSKQLFDRVRPRDVNLEIGVSRARGEMTYYFIAEDSPMNSFSPEFLKQIEMLEHVKQQISVPTLPLAEVLERHLPQGQAIDFMNVDVEGHDLEVLESNDWKRFRPKVIVVEDEGLNPRESAIVRTMKTHGYELCAQNVIILDKINEYFLIDRTTG
ncbi:MAG TPA: FkbM family methyltransferase [Pyrinomonadaceae bacterium]|nr:FkbM family methyltransferase [Pyrinomonadaceae bacterium]